MLLAGNTLRATGSLAGSWNQGILVVSPRRGRKCTGNNNQWSCCIGVWRAVPAPPCCPTYFDRTPLQPCLFLVVFSFSLSLSLTLRLSPFLFLCLFFTHYPLPSRYRRAILCPSTWTPPAESQERDVQGNQPCLEKCYRCILVLSSFFILFINERKQILRTMSKSETIPLFIIEKEDLIVNKWI